MWIWIIIGVVLSQILYKVLKDILPAWFFYSLMVVIVISLLLYINQQ